MKSKAWRVSLSAIFAGLAIAIIQNKVIPCIPALQASFSIGPGAAGWLSSLFCVMGIAAAFPGAAIVGRLGLKRSGLAALLFGLAGTLMGILSNAVSVLMLSRVLEGMGASLIAIVTPALIALWFPPEKRGLPMSVWSAWQILAQSICFFCGAPLADAFGWRGVWGAGGIVTVLAVAVFARFVHLPEEKPALAGPAPGPETGPMAAGLRNPSVWFVCAGMFFFAFGNFGLVTWLAPAWASLFSMELGAANRYISLMYLLALPISVAFGFILNRGRHKKICAASYLLYAFVAAAAFLLPGPRWVVPYIMLYPFFESAVCASVWTLVPETVSDGRHVATAMALFGMLQNAGMLLGPPAAALWMERFGFPALSALVLVSVLLGGGCVALAKTNGPGPSHMPAIPGARSRSLPRPRA